MGLFEQLPYTNFHDLNLTELIKFVKEIAREMSDFEAVNKVKYLGEWDITKSYSPWSIVEDNNIGYIAIREIPRGVDINDRNYWALVADFTALYADLGARIDALERTTKSYFTNKKIVAYGDSTIHNTGMNTYIDQLDDIVECYVDNRGVAGTRMNQSANNGVSLINASTDLTSFDVITLSYGTNEWQTNETVKQIYTDATALINAILAKNPNIDIVFILPSYAFRDFGNNEVNVNTQGLTLEDVNNVIMYAMSRFNIPCIDLYHESMCNTSNYKYLLRDDSGGVYVHPQDYFSRDLAYIVKNFNTGCTPKYDEKDVLATYDFYEGQGAFNNTDYNNAGGLSESGLFLHYGGAYTESTTLKTVMSQSIYRITGHTSEAFTLTCGDYSKNITAGYFDFIVTGLTTGFKSFTIDTTADTVIEDLHIYKVNIGGREIPDATRFGARCKLTVESADITALTGRYAPSVVFDRDTITFDFSGFNVDNAITAGDVIMSIPYAFTTSTLLHSYLYTVKSSTGDVYPLELKGNEISALKAMPTGTYIISSMIKIDRNISLIN